MATKETTACKRCGNTKPTVAKEDGGHKVSCRCGAQVWSAGKKSEAVSEWNASNAKPASTFIDELLLGVRAEETQANECICPPIGPGFGRSTKLGCPVHWPSIDCPATPDATRKGGER